MIFHLGEVEGGISFYHLCEDWFFKGRLLSNPLPPILGRESEEGSNLLPPPTSMVNLKKIIYHYFNELKVEFHD